MIKRLHTYQIIVTWVLTFACIAAAFMHDGGSKVNYDNTTQQQIPGSPISNNEADEWGDADEFTFDRIVGANEILIILHQSFSNPFLYPPHIGIVLPPPEVA